MFTHLLGLRARRSTHRVHVTMKKVGLLVAALTLLVLAPPAAATFPGKNGLIAFQADTGSGSQIYTVRPNGHDLRQITHGAGEASLPDWSPNGQQIAFALGECTIAFVNYDGTGLRVLPSQTPDGCETDPSFTPDGSRIVFERYDQATNDDAIWSMNLQGGDRQRIATSEGGATDPNVSPDGQTLSFLGFVPDGLTAQFTSSIDGSNVAQLTPTLYGIASKSDWAPDGRRLVFSDNADNPDKPVNIATIRPDGTGLRYLTDFRSPDTRAYVGGYSPDGNWIVFRLQDHGRYGLYRMRPDGSARANAGNGTINEAPLAGGSPTTLVSGLNQPVGVAVDASHIYWTDFMAGTIDEAPLTAGSPTTLVSGLSKPAGIAVSP
jgi:Tol biopolymer transport system component